MKDHHTYNGYWTIIQALDATLFVSQELDAAFKMRLIISV